MLSTSAVAEPLFSWRSRYEILNTLTHGLGAVLAIFGGLRLLMKASDSRPAQYIACAVFAACLVAVYVASTLSHLFLRQRWRRLFRILDQGCIYLLIAATFTPFAVACFSGAWWILLVVVWATAFYGCWRKIAHAHKVEQAGVILPLAIGWAPVLSFSHLAISLPRGAVAWILAGGLCYTAGVIVLLFDRRWGWTHAIWHLFVIAGSATHFVAVYRYAT
jgi:hemolysin III